MAFSDATDSLKSILYKFHNIIYIYKENLRSNIYEDDFKAVITSIFFYSNKKYFFENYVQQRKNFKTIRCFSSHNIGL